MNILDDIKHAYNNATIAEKLIYIILAVFIFSLFGDFISNWFASEILLVQSLSATAIASASHRVVNADSPSLALKRRRSDVPTESAKYAMGMFLEKRTPPMPQGLASVEILILCGLSTVP